MFSATKLPLRWLVSISAISVCPAFFILSSWLRTPLICAILAPVVRVVYLLIFPPLDPPISLGEMAGAQYLGSSSADLDFPCFVFHFHFLLVIPA